MPKNIQIDKFLNPLIQQISISLLYLDDFLFTRLLIFFNGIPFCISIKFSFFKLGQIFIHFSNIKLESAVINSDQTNF